MKVLLSAFSCCPGAGSEPGVGWNWVLQISRRHEVWLITSDEYRARIEPELPPNVHATFVPSFQTWVRLQRAPLPGLDWLYYYWWQWKVYRVAKRLHAEHKLELAHHVTFVSWRAPSFLCLLPIPLIWGPVGGGGRIPNGLREELGWKGRFYEAIRDFATSLSRWDPFVRMTMRRAALIIAANRETAALVPKRMREKTRVMLGIGMTGTEKVEVVPPNERTKKFIVLFVALLRPLKGGTLAIKAFRNLSQKRPEAELVMIGDGEEGMRLQALAKELGIAERVRFLGRLPRAQAMGWMQAADVLLHPSLRDSGGLVLMEAMAQGKPVVCLDLGGPGEIVTPECGVRVNPGTPQQVVRDLSTALLELSKDSQRRQLLGQRGSNRVKEEFSWGTRGEQMMSIYEQVVGGRKAKTLRIRRSPNDDGGRRTGGSRQGSRLKILLSAFSCCPGAGSEPGIGWNWVQQISKRHEVWLITSDEYRSKIEPELPDNVCARFVPSFQTWARLRRVPVPGLDWLYYYWWQWKAYSVAKRLHAEHRLDLAHHVTFGSWRAPSFLCLLPIPLVWGPVGGGETVPRGLRNELGPKGRLYESARALGNSLSRFDPAVRLTMKRAAQILVVNRETEALIPEKYWSKTRFMSGIGISGAEKVEAVSPGQRPSGFTVLFVALLEPRKGGTLVIRSLHRLLASGQKANLVIIGRGPEQPRLEALAAELGVSQHVKFLGGQPRTVVLGWMQAADVFLFPTLRDSGGVVVVEAMAQGKPVVCLDLGGPREIVTPECGIKINPGVPEQVVRDLSAALLELSEDSGKRQLLGVMGRKRVIQEFAWEKLGEQMMSIYEQLERNRKM